VCIIGEKQRVRESSREESKDTRTHIPQRWNTKNENLIARSSVHKGGFSFHAENTIYQLLLLLVVVVKRKHNTERRRRGEERGEEIEQREREKSEGGDKRNKNRANRPRLVLRRGLHRKAHRFYGRPQGANRILSPISSIPG
jgi:hypothetical protein